jgi:hypothetical protein
MKTLITLLSIATLAACATRLTLEDAEKLMIEKKTMSCADLQDKSELHGALAKYEGDKDLKTSNILRSEWYSRCKK